MLNYVNYNYSRYTNQLKKPISRTQVLISTKPHTVDIHYMMGHAILFFVMP